MRCARRAARALAAGAAALAPLPLGHAATPRGDGAPTAAQRAGGRRAQDWEGALVGILSGRLQIFAAETRA